MQSRAIVALVPSLFARIVPSMRHRAFALFVCFVCFVGSFFPTTLTAANVEFVRVWPAWRDADSFERIGEYFGKPENTGRATVLRTQPAVRDGYYFLVRVKTTTPAATDAARFELSVIRPDNPEPKTYSFPVTLGGKESVFEFGLTGADWPGGKDVNPVAWKISLLTSDGRTLTEHKSFLWEKPAK
jgi:hypothetical protein